MIRFTKFPATAVALLALTLLASASDVVWQTPVAITASTDVNTQGTLVFADNSGSGDFVTVNGVTFNGNPAGYSSDFNSSGAYAVPSGSIGTGPDATNYGSLLHTGDYQGAYAPNATITLSGLAVGRNYLLQLFVADYRNVGNVGYGVGTRSLTLTGGSNTSGALSFGETTPSASHVIGTFTASGSTQVIHITSATPQVNAFQLRDITPPVPQPAGTITWQAPLAIAASTDVNTQGTLVFADNSGSDNSVTVNGVTFDGNPAGYSSDFDASFAYAVPSGTGPGGDYGTLLNSADYRAGNLPNASITLSGLTDGRNYLLQFFVADYRNVGNVGFSVGARSLTLAGGNNTSAALNFGETTPSASYVIGTFTASGSTQVIDMTSITPQVNAFQLRDLSPPVPGGPGLVNVGPSATFATAALTTDATSIFRLGGGIDDFARILDSGGLTITAGSTPKHIVQIAQQGPIASGIYPLIDYAGSIGGLGFSGLELGPLGRLTGYLVNDTVNSTISLVITGGRTGDLTWTGANGGTWDVATTSNWMWNDGTDLADMFYNGDTVRLDDSGTTGALTLAGAIEPAEVVVDNTDLDYSLSGSGGISGPARFYKSGTGILTVANPNTYSGETTVIDGTLRIGDGGSLGLADINNFGTLEIDCSGTLAFSNRIKGTGSVTKSGVGTVTLSSTNTYTGNTTVNAGTLRLGNGTSPTGLSNSASVIVAPGAMLDLNYTGTDVINALWLDGQPMPPGVYSSSNSAFITGLGTLTVTNGPAADNFATWSGRGGYNLSGGPTGDDDHDGIANLLEYVFGGNPLAHTASTVMPTASAASGNFVFRFTRVYSSATDTTQIFQYSMNLTTWSDVPLIHGGMVSIQSNTPQTDTVTITVPTGSNSKMFGRLKVTAPLMQP